MTAQEVKLFSSGKFKSTPWVLSYLREPHRHSFELCELPVKTAHSFDRDFTRAIQHDSALLRHETRIAELNVRARQTNELEVDHFRIPCWHQTTLSSHEKTNSTVTFATSASFASSLDSQFKVHPSYADLLVCRRGEN